MKVKYAVMIIITTLLLLVLGFLFLPTLLLQLTKGVIGNKLVVVSPWESFNFVLANALLLATCAPAAAVALWAYSRRRPGWPRIYGFFVGLSIAIVSAAAGVGLRLLVIANLMIRLGELGSTTAIAVSNLHYARWGFGALVIVCVVMTTLSLVLSQQREESLE